LAAWWGENLVILQKKVPGLTKAALERFVARAQRAAAVRGDINVLVTGNAEILALNLRFRGKNKATDVLSFPSSAASFIGRRALAGDIAISADIATENAARYGHGTSEEVKILVLHGILHLAGLDHERDNGAMARKEARLREVLKLPPSLIERVGSGKSHSSKKSRKGFGAGEANA
jgi:probable rRNA maturation factor